MYAYYLLQHFIYNYRSINAKATQYGKKHEMIARQKYEEIEGVKVQNTGLTLLSRHHFIGSTADGIIDKTILEIKCPYSGQNKRVAKLVNSGYFHLQFDNNVFKLKETSPYYFQVQGEMALKQRDLCNFIVWTPFDIQIIDVPYNKTFWEIQLLPRLIKNFDSYIRPCLLAQS
jgi:hypothetical protein